MKVHNLLVTGSLTSGGENITAISSSVSSTVTSLSSSVSTSIGSLSSSMVSSMTSLSSSLTSSMGSLSSSMASSMTTLSSSLTGSMGSLSSSMVTSMNSLSSSMGSIMATTGSNLFKGNQTISGSIIPAVNGLYDLGSITNEFRDLYLSSASLYIDGTKVLGSTTQELTITTDTGQSFKILESGSDTITLQAADGNITFATSGGGDVILDPTNGIIALKGTTTLYAGNRILSSDGNAIQIGNSVTMTGSLIVTGFIETQELRTTYISSSILYRSGSTKFGDELTDTHSFSGSVLISGSISVPGSNLVSGSSQITYSGLSGVPSGIISGSSQLPSGIVSSSAQTIANLPSGVVSGSAQTIANLPSGVVSGSSQVLAGTTIHSGSFFNGISVVSGSVQVDVMSTTNIARLATTGSNVFTGALSGTSATFSSGIATLGYTASTSYAALFNGSVGIGTTNPSTQLSGTIGLSIVNATNAALGLSNGTNNWLNYLSGTTYRIWNNTTFETMVIHLNGNTTIGASGFDAGYKLDVSGTGRFVSSNNTTPLTISAGSNATFEFKGNSTSGYAATFNINDTALYIGHNSASRNLVLQTASVDRLTISGSGAATFSSSVRLTGTLFANTQFNNTLLSSSDATNIANGFNLLGSSSYWGIRTLSNGDLSWDVYNSNSPKSALYIANNSNVLIGTTTDAGYKLDVSGTGRFTGALTGTSATFSTTNGVIGSFVGTGGKYGQIYSDANAAAFAASTSTSLGTDYLYINPTSHFIALITNGVERLNIASTGTATFTCSNSYASTTNHNIRLTNTGYRNDDLSSYSEGGYLDFYFENYNDTYGGTAYDRVLDIVAKGSPDGTYGKGVIRFKANSKTVGSNSTEIMRISGDGYVKVQGSLTTTGNITNQGAIFTQAGVTRHCFSGSVAGSGTLTFTINSQSQSVFRITCMMNHYGYVPSYGCANESFVGIGPVITVTTIADVQSANGGSWSYARINDQQFTVTKNAGTYGGGGNYFVEIVGNNSY